MIFLVIDDDDQIIESLKNLLEKNFAQTEIRTADSSRRAIEVLKKTQNIDLIICDNNMPGGSGEEVLTYLGSAGFKIPFICYSGSKPSWEEGLNLVKDIIPVRFIQKPEVHNLTRAIHTLLKGA